VKDRARLIQRNNANPSQNNGSNKNVSIFRRLGGQLAGANLAAAIETKVGNGMLHDNLSAKETVLNNRAKEREDKNPASNSNLNAYVDIDPAGLRNNSDSTNNTDVTMGNNEPSPTAHYYLPNAPEVNAFEQLSIIAEGRLNTVEEETFEESPSPKPFHSTLSHLFGTHIAHPGDYMANSPTYHSEHGSPTRLGWYDNHGSNHTSQHMMRSPATHHSIFGASHNVHGPNSNSSHGSRHHSRSNSGVGIEDESEIQHYLAFSFKGMPVSSKSSHHEYEYEQL
jgi:hypothetical protein